MRITGRAIILLLLLAIAAGWFGYRKWERYRNDPARLEAKKTAEDEAKKKEAEARNEEYRKKFAEARQRDLQKAGTAQPEQFDYKKILRQLNMAANVSPEERFPLPETARTLEGAVALPQERAKVVYMAPLYGAGAESTSATESLESMLRYQLRSRERGPVRLNLVPMQYVQTPYHRTNAPLRYRDLPPDQYLRDAGQLGADVFVYGRADLVQGSSALQLAIVDLATSRTQNFAQSVTADKLPEMLRSAAASVAQLAAVDANALGDPAGALPTASVLQIALTSHNDRDGTSALQLAEETNPQCPWLFEHLIYTTRSTDKVAVANEALRRWPDDARLFLSKGHSLQDTGAQSAAYLFMSELVRRQPDSLIAVANLRQALRQMIRQNEYDPVAAGGYYNAYLHFDQLVQRYPNNWILLWERATCAAQAGKNASLASLQELLKIKPDLTGITPADLEAGTKQYRELPARALADLRRALQIRPDCPDLIVDMIYWHYHLTDRQGEDAPEKAILWQYPLLARINNIDPQNIEADLTVALHQAGARNSRQLDIVREILKRTNNAPAATSRVASNLVEVLRQKMKWYEEYERRKENAHLMASTPEAQLFVDALTIALAADQQLWPGQQDIAWWIDSVQPRPDGIWSRVYAHKNGHFKAAQTEHKSEHWEKALYHARRCVDLVDKDGGHLMRWIIVRSLYKLERFRECLKEAEYSSYLHPDKHTFHYFFAVAANRLDIRLEEAWERIQLAAQLDPENPGVQEVQARLKQKLGK